MLVIRSRRRELQAVPPEQLTADLADTAAEVHSIEEFIARADALPEGKKPEPRPDHVRDRDQARLEHLAEHHLVEEVLSVGTMIPAVAAQAQVELTWVLKQIAMAAGRLQKIYVNTKHVLDSVSGFKGLGHMRDCFQTEAVHRIERLVDADQVT